MDLLRLIKKIEASGIKKGHIAKQVGMHPTTLSCILTGKIKYVSDQMLKDIEEYIDKCKTTF